MQKTTKMTIVRKVTTLLTNQLNVTDGPNAPSGSGSSGNANTISQQSSGRSSGATKEVNESTNNTVNGRNHNINHDDAKNVDCDKNNNELSTTIKSVIL